MNENTLLGCPYCGDTQDMPSEEILEKFGDIALKCCDFEMLRLDRRRLYQILKGMDELKRNIEAEITKDF